MLSKTHRFEWLSSINQSDLQRMRLVCEFSWAAGARKAVPVKIERLCQNVIMINDLSAIGPDRMTSWSAV